MTASHLGYTAIHGMFSPEKCLYGHYADAATITSASPIPDCQFVPPGKTCGSACTGSTQEVNCPTGYWCNAADENSGAIHKYPCPPGYKANAGTNHATMADACTLCSAGSYCDGADLPETACPAGYFCPAGTKFATQFPCPAATKSSVGASSAADCTACAAGKFCPPGTGIDRACPPGSSCQGLQLDRYSDLCAAGKYFDGTSCVTCPANHYCPPGIAFPLMCPAGTYGANNANGNCDRIEDCLPCNQAQLCPIYGAGSDASYAPVSGSGYYATHGTEFKNQLPCPAGSYSSGSPTHWSQCIACPDGFACPEGTGTLATLQTKLKCEPGYYCKTVSSQGTKHVRQYPCPAGTWTASDSLSDSASCSACTAGYYCPEGSYREYECPPGYFCETSTGNFLDSPCAKGTYRAAPKGTSQADCAACPAGHYCNT